jgi:hypothetical protein
MNLKTNIVSVFRMTQILVPLVMLTIICTTFAGCQPAPLPAAGIVSFRHLDHLTEHVVVGGDSVAIVHVYANYPAYEWVDARESGPEGIACVDDAARAAVVLLRDFELHGRPGSLARARPLLKFILAMQTEDGQFYNFVHKDNTINRDGKTSFKSFGWWAARGTWALGLGYRILQHEDSAFALRLRAGVERSLPHVTTMLANYGLRENEGAYAMPRWLLYGSGADATGELFLGLVEFYKAVPTPHLAEMLRKLAEGFMLMQDGDITTFPFGAHRSWRTMVHLWGNGQTQGLASAGKLLGDTAMIASARREADGFFTRVVCEGLFKEMDVREPEGKQEFDQIAYAVRPLVLGSLRLYDATGNKDYLRLAGICASWLFGNNPAGAVMYDTATGRCYDGIRDNATLNLNSGAESTIEALYALVELEVYPEAMAYARCRKVSTASTPAMITGVFALPDGRRCTVHIDLQQRRFWCEQEG